MKYDRRYNDAENNSNNPVSDRVEICIRRKSLENAQEERQGNLQTRICNPLAACRDPSSEGSPCCGEEQQRNDALHVRHEVRDREKTKQAAERAADEPQSRFAQRGFAALEGDKDAGDKRGAYARPIQCGV